jgi:hypothetical protein
MASWTIIGTWNVPNAIVKLRVKCVVCKSSYKTNLKCTGILTQQMHNISSYMFQHALGDIIRESSL